MTQETALFGEFSIQESLYFYGRLFGMSKKDIEENISFLIGFLNLPQGDRWVKTLRYLLIKSFKY
jgi:ABC-type multidrug transport system ATPase subunit